MLTKCLTMNNVMWSVAIVVRYERWVICILYGSHTYSITMFKTSWRYIFWFCYQTDISTEVWSPANKMFQNCCLNQLFLLLSEKRSSACSMSFQNEWLFIAYDRIHLVHSHAIISLVINNFSIDIAYVTPSLYIYGSSKDNFCLLVLFL